MMLVVNGAKRRWSWTQFSKKYSRQRCSVQVVAPTYVSLSLHVSDIIMYRSTRKRNALWADKTACTLGMEELEAVRKRNNVHYYRVISSAYRDTCPMLDISVLVQLLSSRHDTIAWRAAPSTITKATNGTRLVCMVLAIRVVMTDSTKQKSNDRS